MPVPHLKKVYGRSLMVEVLQETVTETSNKAIADRKERPAMQPSVSLPEDQAEIERVLAGEADLAYSMTFEVLPPVELADFKALKLERLVADVDAEAVDKAVGELVERNVTFTPEEERAAADRRSRDDRLRRQDRRRGVRGRHGRGRADRARPGQLHPRLRGRPRGRQSRRGARRRRQPSRTTIRSPTLAGKPATFAVKVKEVATPVRPEVDDEFAKTLGAESVATS